MYKTYSYIVMYQRQWKDTLLTKNGSSKSGPKLGKSTKGDPSLTSLRWSLKYCNYDSEGSEITWFQNFDDGIDSGIQ